MKLSIGALAVLALGGVLYASPSQAQVPPGSYMRSCSDARVEGDRLVANCQRTDGRRQFSALPEVRRCVGDIGNDNGQLRCAYAGGPPPAPAAAPPPAYGQAPGYGQAPANGDTCEHLRQERHFLRERLERTSDPAERDHLAHRLEELRAREGACPR